MSRPNTDFMPTQLEWTDATEELLEARTSFGSACVYHNFTEVFAVLVDHAGNDLCPERKFETVELAKAGCVAMAAELCAKPSTPIPASGPSRATCNRVRMDALIITGNVTRWKHCAPVNGTW